MEGSNYNKKTKRSIFAWAFLGLLAVLFCHRNGYSQVSYTVKVDADKQTYRVFMRSVASYTGIQAKISTAQVTILVPTGTGLNQFVPSNVTGKQVGSNSMSWGASRSDAPTENPTKDYISFGFSGSGSPILFDIVANQEIELFNFKNTNNCQGEVSLITNSDPFLPPNSQNSNPGNQMTILGFGASNAYTANYGTNPTCLSAFTDLKLNISGPANITAGTAANFSFVAENIGTNASNGQYTATITLPNGLNYNSASGADWTVNAASQVNGTTILTATNTGIIAAGGASSTLQINATAAANVGNGNAVNIVGTIAGGNDMVLSNNSSTFSSTVALNTVDLNLAFTGPSTISPNSTASYALNINNIGNAGSTGNIQGSVILPSGISYTSFTGNGWSFAGSTSLSGGATQLNFTYSNAIAAGGMANTLNILTSTASNLINNTVLQTTLNISGGGDQSPANNSATFNSTVVVNSVPSLSVSLLGGSSSVGGTATNLVLNLNNTGSGATTGNISSTITLPNGFQYNSFSGNGWSVNPVSQPNGTTVLTSVFSGNIPSGATATPLILNITPPTQGGNFQLTGNYSGGGAISGTINTSINVSPSVSAIISSVISGPSTISVNNSYNYTINLTNSGTGITSGNIQVNTILPAGLTFNNATGTNWSSTSSLQPNGTTVVVSTYTATIPSNGAAIGLILNMTPSNTLNNGQNIIISGNTSGGGATGSNFSTNVTVNNPSVTIYADIAVMAAINNPNPNVGQQVQYTFTVTNNGTGVPTNIQNNLKLPLGFVINNVVVTAGNYNSNTKVWLLNSLNVGQSQTLTIFGFPQSQGIDFGSIIISNSSLPDSITKNNSAKICYATPVSLCAGEGFKAHLEAGATNIKWFKNNVQIPGITADSLLITSIGQYSATYKNACNESIISPIINILAGSLPNAPTISALKNTICSPESLQLTATNCQSNVIWSTGETTNTININSAGTYTAKCVNTCGESTSSAPFAVTQNCLGSIGDFVWYDSNNNGRQDVGEIPVAGVVMELFKDGLTTNRKDTTDVNGKYLFGNLIPGNYQIKIHKTSFPATYLLSSKPNQSGVPDDKDSDFEYATALSHVVSVTTNAILTVDAGLKTKPESDISDPCHCFNVEYSLKEKKELFETVTVNGPINDTWRIIEQRGMLDLDSLVKRPVALGTPLVEIQPGKYELNFTHEDSVGYFVRVSNGVDTLEIGNFCSVYPYVSVTELSETICKNAAPIPLTVQMSTPGTAQYFYVDKQTQQKVYITEFDPKKFPSGETIYIKLELMPASGLMCTYTLVQTVSLTAIDCDVCDPNVCLPINIRRIKLD